MRLHEAPALATERLLLRGFLDADVDALAEMNADPVVMRYLGGVRSPEWCAASIERCRQQWSELGFGRFVVEDKAIGKFAGWVTLDPVELDGYTDDVEIGWRLVRACWGQGIATELAAAVLDWAFASLPVDRVLAVADTENARSISVMRRLGMVHLADVPDEGRMSTIWCTTRGLRTGAAR